MKEKFVFDTNVLIDLKKFNPLVFKSLWHNLNDLIKNNLICSVLEVQNELSKSEDLLNEKWKEIDNDYGFFVDLSEKENSREYWSAIGELESFEKFQQYGENRPYWADPYLIAMGMVDNHIVVTNETINRQKERKIPFVCNELGVSCMSFDDFMIYQGWEW